MSKTVQRVLVAVGVGIALGVAQFLGFDVVELAQTLGGLLPAPEATESIAEGAAANLTQ